MIIIKYKCRYQADSLLLHLRHRVSSSIKLKSSFKKEIAKYFTYCNLPGIEGRQKLQTCFLPNVPGPSFTHVLLSMSCGGSY